MKHENSTKRLVTITDGRVEVGVLPDLGGMVACLRLRGMRNILKADETLWNKPPLIRKTFADVPRWTAYNGHIVWLGPQNDWWINQNKIAQKKLKRDVWPPDPYINNGSFDVVKQTDSEIVMLGPPSDFSGVQLTKSIKVKDGKVRFKVSATNIRKTKVSWDLWLNTRVDGYARCYAPVQKIENVRIDVRPSATVDACDFKHDDGYIHITSQKPTGTKTSRFGKAFIPASRGLMAAFVSGQALVIKFKKHSQKLIHPEQALVEFYNYTDKDKNNSLTELEYHAPYITLAPNETMSAEQVWEVYKFKTKPNHEECLEFLESL